jgi:hypothetical protein
VRGDVSPGLVFALLDAFELHLVEVFVESHYFLANTRSSSVLLLVVEVEYLLPCTAATIIHYRLGQDTHKRRFA